MKEFHYIFGLCFLLTGTITAFLLQRQDTNHTSEEWSEWKVMQEYPICFLTRARHCVSEGCTENEKEYRYCNDVASWGEWGPWQCTIKVETCFIGRNRNCSVQALSDCYSNETNHEVTVWRDFKSCPCAEGVQSLMSTSSILTSAYSKSILSSASTTSILSSASTTNIISSTSTPSSAVLISSTVPSSKSTSVGLTSSLDTTLSSTSSSASAAVGLTTSVMASSVAPCNDSVCQDKVRLEQSGHCRGYVSDERHCVDASTCNIIDTPFHPICKDKHVSHEICPKACGCCEVNGEWTVWQEWSKCSHSCSGGTRTRVRTCTNPAASHGGQDCAGNKTETEACYNAKCPEWTQWFYGACSVTCGNGTTMRLRHCSSGKDLDCGTGNAVESATCNEIPCI